MGQDMNSPLFSPQISFVVWKWVQDYWGKGGTVTTGGGGLEHLSLVVALPPPTPFVMPLSQKIHLTPAHSQQFLLSFCDTNWKALSSQITAPKQVLTDNDKLPLNLFSVAPGSVSLPSLGMCPPCAPVIPIPKPFSCSCVSSLNHPQLISILLEQRQSEVQRYAAKSKATCVHLGVPLPLAGCKPLLSACAHPNYDAVWPKTSTIPL